MSSPKSIFYKLKVNYFFKPIFLIAVFALFSSSGFSQSSSWEFKHPSITGNQIFRFSGIKGTGFVYGLSWNNVIKSNDSGITWQTKPIIDEDLPGFEDYVMQDLVFIDSLNAIAVGRSYNEEGVIFKTDNGGNTWQKNSINISYMLYTVCFSSDSIGYAAGGSELGFGSILLKTIDRGNTWSFLNTNTSYLLNDLAFENDSIGYVISNYTNECLITKDGGNTWTVSLTTIAGLKAVFINSDSSAIITGTDKLFRTENYGATWDSISYEPEMYGQAISFTSKDTGYISGKHRLFKTTDRGETWSLVNTFIYGFSYAIYCNTPNDCYVAAGDYGFRSQVMLYKTTDSWITSTELTNKKVGYGAALIGEPADFLSMHFPTASTGYACGDYSYVVKTKDKGITWDSLNTGALSLSSAFPSYYSAFFTDTLSGCIVGRYPNTFIGITSKTTDGGLSWTNQYFTDILLNDVFFISRDTGFCSGFTSNPGEGIMLKTTDGGITWNTEMVLPPGANSAILNSIDFITPQIGIIAGDGAFVLKTTDGGNTWNTINTPVAVQSIQFTDTNTLYFAYFRFVYKSTDGGNTWFKVLDIPGPVNHTINTLFFTDNNTGYAGGRIDVKYPGFMYKTEDGGNTWREISINNYQPVNDIYFTSKDTGYFGGGGATIMITHNGGGVITGIPEYFTNNKISTFTLYPNPFNNKATVNFFIPASTKHAEVAVYDITGNKLKSYPIDNNMGEHSVLINSDNIAAGIYIISLHIDSKIISTQKMIIIK